MAEEDTHNEAEKDEVEILEDDGDVRTKIESLKRQLKECRTAKDEYLGGWQRAKADYVNSERMFREREERSVRRAEEKLLRDLLTIIDSLDNAFAASPPDSPWVLGIKGIHEQARSLLERYGITVIDTIGKAFSPHMHEAVEVSTADDESGDNIIIAELQKGYAMGESVLRPAKVKVARYHK